MLLQYRLIPAGPAASAGKTTTLGDMVTDAANRLG